MPTMLLMLICLVLTACTLPGDGIKTGDDTLSASAYASQAEGGIEAAQEQALSKADQYCSGRAMELMVTHISTTTSVLALPGKAEITFQCVDILATPIGNQIRQ